MRKTSQQIYISVSDFLPFASDEQQRMTRNNLMHSDEAILPTPHRDPNRCTGDRVSAAEEYKSGELTKVSTQHQIN